MESESNEESLESSVPNKKRIIYKDCVVNCKFEHIADHIENFEVRDDDIWVCTFPKSGTTWMQEMVWNIANDLHFKRAQIPIDKRFPYLELPGVSSTLPKLEEVSESTKKNLDPDLQYIETIAKYPSPRFIKTHLPYQLLPRQLREGKKKSRIVYVTRNVKDTCISYYHFIKLISGDSNLPFEEYCKAFLEDKIIYEPYWNHVKGYLNKTDNNNILCVKFEDMKSDLRSVIRKVAIFLGRTLNDEQLERLENHLSFSNMKENPAVNYEPYIAKVQSKNERLGLGDAVSGKFMRSGEVGQWKTLMSEELIKQFDDWIKENSKDI